MSDSNSPFDETLLGKWFNSSDSEDYEGTEITKIELTHAGIGSRTADVDLSPTEQHERLTQFFNSATDADNTDTRLLSIELTTGENGEPVVSITPKSQRMGFQGLDIDTGKKTLQDSVGDDDVASDFGLEGLSSSVQLEVPPKKDAQGTAWVQLLAAASGPTSGDLLNEMPASGTDDTLNFELLIVGIYINAIDALFNEYGGLREQHRRVQRELEAQVRGKLHVAEYLGSLSQGDVTTVPCEFSELQLDNAPNRTLRWGLHLCQRLLQTTAMDRSEGGDNIKQRLRTQMRRFGDVTRTHIRPGEVPDPATLPTAFSGYVDSGALPLARRLINEAEIGLDADQAAHTVGFSFQLFQEFEDAFAKLLAAEWDCDSDTISQWSQSLSVNRDDVSVPATEAEPDSDNGIRPDVFIHPEAVPIDVETAVVADTKWKFGADIDQGDLYQITAYTHYFQQRHDDVVGFLIYPSSGGTVDAVRSTSITHPAYGSEADVHAVWWPVGAGGNETIRETCAAVANKMQNIIGD
jgi:5-methylcytosine-specific restriction endonuclease McrBC regulatory subunit McrC